MSEWVNHRERGNEPHSLLTVKFRFALLSKKCGAAERSLKYFLSPQPCCDECSKSSVSIKINLHITACAYSCGLNKHVKDNLPVITWPLLGRNSCVVWLEDLCHGWGRIDPDDLNTVIWVLAWSSQIFYTELVLLTVIAECERHGHSAEEKGLVKDKIKL